MSKNPEATPGSDILHVTVLGVYHMTNKELATTLRRLADEADNGGISNSQPGDVAVTRSNAGGGGPCGPQEIEVTVSLVPPRKWPIEIAPFAEGTPGV